MGLIKKFVSLRHKTHTRQDHQLLTRSYSHSVEKILWFATRCGLPATGFGEMEMMANAVELNQYEARRRIYL
ncbi:hypothetical protein F511_20848 [Dorcoceras hygrometricum]|uniref:Uncharacterized protein n=1 Tax=Dorcoceras hygrometricum TaxID=472368 RepID=A0A2Z7C9M5_9LAMI|nr:hypothetical protein F511_20848 [Dorcoceras hygrometricum]